MFRSWKVEVYEKKKNSTGRSADQSAISSKEHVQYEATQTYFCRLRTNTTACTWPANDLTITAKESETTATTKNAILQRVFSGKKTSIAYDAIRDECMPLTDFFRGYCRLLLRLCVAQLGNICDISLFILEPNYVRLEF